MTYSSCPLRRIDQVVVALPITTENRLKGIFDKLTVIPADLRLSINTVTAQLPIRGIGYFADVPVLDIVHTPLRHARSLCKCLKTSCSPCSFLLLSVR